MLYVICGTDVNKARDKFGLLVKSLQKKKPEVELFVFDADNWDIEKFKSLISGQGLFEKKYIVSMSRIPIEDISSHLKDFKGSENIFILFTEKLLSKDKKRLEKYSEKLEEHNIREKAKEEFNIFSITDALGNRDKKRLWVLYQKAVKAGKTTEEIHGILLWQLKAIVVSYKEKTAKDSGMKPFVFSKAKSFSKNYLKEEAEKKLFRFMEIYNESRLGKSDFALSLEKEILSI